MITGEPSLVVDSCVALAWALQDEGGSYAEAIEATARREGFFAPPHWHTEIANVLLRKERAGDLDDATSKSLIIGFEQLRVVTDTAGWRRMYHDTMVLARRHGLSTYDAAYLEVAIRRKLRLATLNSQLTRAAKTEGVSLLEWTA